MIESKLVMRIFILLLLPLFCSISVNATPFKGFTKRLDQAKQTRAISNAKKIYVGLFMFALDHDGKFPTGNTAEACFNQLIKAGYIKDESIFWTEKSAKFNVVAATAPNNDGILTAAENSWGYVSGLTTSSSTSTPVLFDSSTKVGEFNMKMWMSGEAIIGHLDGSVMLLKIESKKAQIKNEKKPSVGSILKIQGTQEIDIFAELPAQLKVLPPQMVK